MKISLLIRGADITVLAPLNSNGQFWRALNAGPLSIHKVQTISQTKKIGLSQTWICLDMPNNRYKF